MWGSWGCRAPSPKVQPKYRTNPGFKILKDEPVMVSDFMKAIVRQLLLYADAAHQSEGIWAKKKKHDDKMTDIAITISCSC